MPSDAQGGQENRQGAGRPFARLLRQLARQRQPHARIRLHQNVALSEYRRGPDTRNDAQESGRRRAGSRHFACRATQKRRPRTRGGDPRAQDADSPSRRHALPDAHGTAERPRRQPAARPYVRQPLQPPFGVGFGASRSGPSVELYRVAAAARPSQQGGGRMRSVRRTARLGAGNARYLYRNL